MSEIKILLEKLRKINSFQKSKNIEKFINILAYKQPRLISGKPGDIIVNESNMINSQIRQKIGTDPGHIKTIKKSILSLGGEIKEPILAFENLNGEKFVLNGVHRVEAFQELYGEKKEEINKFDYKIPAIVLTYSEWSSTLLEDVSLMQLVQACLNDHLPNKPNTEQDIKRFISNRIKYDSRIKNINLESFIKENLLEISKAGKYTSRDSDYRDHLVNCVSIVYLNTNSVKSIKGHITKTAKRLLVENNNQIRDMAPQGWVEKCVEVFSKAHRNKQIKSSKLKDFYECLQSNYLKEKEKMFLSSHGSTFDQKVWRDFKSNFKKNSNFKTVRISASQKISSEEEIKTRQNLLWRNIAEVYEILTIDLFNIWCADYIVFSPQVNSKNINDISSWEILSKEEIIEKAKKIVRKNYVL